MAIPGEMPRGADNRRETRVTEDTGQQCHTAVDNNLARFERRKVTPDRVLNIMLTLVNNADTVVSLVTDQNFSIEHRWICERCLCPSDNCCLGRIGNDCQDA